MLITKEKLQHINSITHEGKVVVVATDADGKLWYTVKQDGFEDTYLNTPSALRTGWESWQALELPNETVDPSVIAKDTAELTYQSDPSQFLLRARYQTQAETAVAPAQLISALGHLYLFRQSKANTLLVDRFVLDGMTNKLNRKLEVRFKRSRQKHQPSKSMGKGNNGLQNVDSLDFRDANGAVFYEPTTELCLVNHLSQGWFSPVLVPTVENDVYRWHIFAYNGATQKVELTTLRASDDGLFDVKDYNFFAEADGELVPRKIPGVLKRTLDIGGVTVTNGLAATKYDLQQEQETQSGEKQLLKTATRLLLAVPTDKGTAAFSFAIASDGTLAQISEAPERTTIRSQQREILLPLNTLDEIKVIGDRTPPPQGIITGMTAGTPEDDAEDLVKLTTEGKAGELATGDQVKITGTHDYQGRYRANKVDENIFEIDWPAGNGLGYWEKVEAEEGGLIFDGMITAYQKTPEGKLLVTCAQHGLENGDEVQIVGNEAYDNTYPVRKLDDTHFVIERKWPAGEALNINVVTRKRRGVVFDGAHDYIEIPYQPQLNSKQFTIECWVKAEGGQGSYCSPLTSRNTAPSAKGYILYMTPANRWELWIGNGDWQMITGPVVAPATWTHLAGTYDGATLTLYINGQRVGALNTSYTPNTDCPLRIGAGATEGQPAALFPGQMAEVRIWKAARSAEAIQNNMDLRLTGKEVDLVGYWRLGAIAEQKVLDFSVNGYDGAVHGDPYVSAITLNRQLANGTAAVKYSNPELFAVSERATYEESFEFKVKASFPVDLAYLENADGKGLGAKLFTFSHWGKTSRSAEEKSTVPSVQNNFADLGNGWYRAACSFTVPAGISLLRSFEITNLQGNWDALEIRKQRVRLVSDSITEAKYMDSTTLTMLADDQAEASTQLRSLAWLEQQERMLVDEKNALEEKLRLITDPQALQQRVDALRAEVDALTKESDELKGQWEKEMASPFNYYCRINNKLLNKVLEPRDDWDEWRDREWRNREWRDRDEWDNVVGLRSSVNDPVNDMQLWEFTSIGDNYWIRNKRFRRELNLRDRWSRGDSLVRLPSWRDGHYDYGYDIWTFVPRDEKYYRINSEYSSRALAPVDTSDRDVNLVGVHDEFHEQNEDALLWELLPTPETTNDKITEAGQFYTDKLNQLRPKQQDLAEMEGLLGAERALEEKLAQVKANLVDVETKINLTNARFLDAVKQAQQTAQAMPQVAKDSQGLLTQAALLAFVQPSSRLHALETSEGNVQLSYFDTQGRLRQTNYDVTADAQNTAFEQWLPDAQRACLNFSNSNSVVELTRSIILPAEWSIEVWFVYPLPPTTDEWNCLIAGVNDNTPIMAKKGKQLGVYLGAALAGQNFFDSGFNLETLTPGWHHLTAVGRADTTHFYIDGEKVGDTKAKALADAEAALGNAPDDATAKQNVAALKKAAVKVTNSIETLGNRRAGGRQSGKIAEVRIWGIALSDEEVAVNSQTLLSGNEPGLLAYYPMNEATGEDLRDSTGNGHNGTIMGASWWACAAPIGHLRYQVMQFDGAKAYVETPPHTNPTTAITVSLWAKSQTPIWNAYGCLVSKRDAYVFHPNRGEKSLSFYIVSSSNQWPSVTFTPDIDLTQWHHYAGTFDGQTLRLYIDGVEVAQAGYPGEINADSGAMYIGKDDGLESYFNGQIAEVCIWNVGHSQAEIQANMHKRLTGKESHLVAYYPLNEIKLEGFAQKVLDLAGNNHGTVTEAIMVESNSLPMGKDALIANEYNTVTLDPNTKRQVSIMRRFLAYPQVNAAVLLVDKRVEEVELKWIGNGQFAPTLLGYIEGAPPIPSENLTFGENYNGVTSVELTVSEDVTFTWKRSQNEGIGKATEISAGIDFEEEVGFIVSETVATIKAGVKGHQNFGYEFQNESSITSNSSLSMADKLQLCGSEEEEANFPHLGKRFIPKNVGYALVVSALADVFVTRLQRTGKMIGYQVLPVENIPPDINTITFLINPAYVMSGSLDGLTGSSATSQRFFKHVPEMRAQFGALYPASYYRLQEAYDLKQQIEQQDKNREAYFAQFNSLLVDETSLARETDRGDAPGEISVNRAEDKPDDKLTDEEKKAADKEKQAKVEAQTSAAMADQSEAEKKKRAEIDQKIQDQEKKSHATASFAAWQRKMEDIQIRAGKRNIVNTYVWDADGGLRTEAQSFANTAEHSIGGSFSLDASLGTEMELSLFGVAVGLNVQSTINLTQTMSKTEARSRGIELNVGFVAPSGVGVERRGVTDYNDNPMLPGEKVNRYRFMSFYLEGSTSNFKDFFSYVVDPEWLAGNSEEARALRRAKGKANKAWRVLHRVTYVERPALMGFGRDLRQLRAAAQASENQLLLDKITKLEENNKKLEAKLDQILKALQV